METLFESVDQPVIDENKEYFAELVGEDKKFKTPEALARKAVYADAHIQRLEAEAKELREKAATAATIQDFLDKMEKANKTQVNPSNSQPNEQQDPPSQPNTLTPDSVKALVREALTETQRQTSQEQNLSYVQTVLRDKFGNNFSAVLSQKAQSLGVGTAFLDQLAKEQPKAFLALVGLEAPQPRVTNPVSSSTSTNPSSMKMGQKNYAHYRKMMKDNPDLRHSADLHNEMMKQIDEMGEEAFYAP